MVEQQAEQPEVTRIAGPHSGKSGPTHALYGPGHHIAWCGIKPQFRHWQRSGSAGDVTCAKCLRGLKRGRPYAWGS